MQPRLYIESVIQLIAISMTLPPPPASTITGPLSAYRDVLKGLRITRPD